MIGLLLWILGVLSLIGMWIAMRTGEFWGFDPSFWWMNAVAFGILAIPLKLHAGKMGMMCKTQCGGEGCKGGCCNKMEDITK